MEEIQSYITRILTLDGPMLVVALLISIGYMAKMARWMPNKWIPPMLCLIVGPALSVVLLPFTDVSKLDFGLHFPLATQWAQVLSRGVMLGVLAWYIHDQVLYKLIDEKLAKRKAERLARKTPPVLPSDSPRTPV